MLQEGEADGTIVGGNLCTLNLLQGTPFMPPLEGSMVFAEDDEQVRPWDYLMAGVSFCRVADAISGGPAFSRPDASPGLCPCRRWR